MGWKEEGSRRIESPCFTQEGGKSTPRGCEQYEEDANTKKVGLLFAPPPVPLEKDGGGLSDVVLGPVYVLFVFRFSTGSLVSSSLLFSKKTSHLPVTWKGHICGRMHQRTIKYSARKYAAHRFADLSQRTKCCVRVDL